MYKYGAFSLKNYCSFNYCSDVCGFHRSPQTLAGICSNMGFRAVAARGNILGFILLFWSLCRWATIFTYFRTQINCVIYNSVTLQYCHSQSQLTEHIFTFANKPTWNEAYFYKYLKLHHIGKTNHVAPAEGIFWKTMHMAPWYLQQISFMM